MIHCRCVLSYDDVFPLGKLRSSASLRRLVLDGFFLNDLHLLVHFYPSLEHLSIHRVLVNFRGYLPPFQAPISTLKSLQLTCFYTVRLEYIAHLLGFFPDLQRFNLTAIGTDFLNAERWSTMLAPLEHLRVLSLDIKAIVETLTEGLTSSFRTGFWRQWPVAIDYSQDNRKLHLFTVPYRRASFISTIHCLPVLTATRPAFSAVTDLYLKMNLPTKVTRMTFASSLFFYDREFRFVPNEAIPMSVLFKSIRMPLLTSMTSPCSNRFNRCSISSN